MGVSAEFYAHVLGMECVPRPDFPFGGAWLTAGDATLHIIEADTEVPRLNRSLPYLVASAIAPWHIRRGRHVAFSVSSAPAWERHLLSSGVHYTKFVAPTTGAVQLFFLDPDGHGVELVAPA